MLTTVFRRPRRGHLVSTYAQDFANLASLTEEYERMLRQPRSSCTCLVIPFLGQSGFVMFLDNLPPPRLLDIQAYMRNADRMLPIATLASLLAPSNLCYLLSIPYENLQYCTLVSQKFHSN